MKTIFFAFPGNEKISSELIQKEKAEEGKFELRNFPDGETYLRILSPVENQRTVIVCSLHQPDEKILKLFLFAKTLKSLGAREVILIAPYLAYMRQDKIFKAGEGISSHYVAEFISSFIDGIITIDPHLHRIKNLSDIYAVKTKVLHAATPIAQWIKTNIPKALLIGPDSESEQWVSEIAQKAGADFTILEKHRSGDMQVEVSVPHVEKYKDHTPVLVDDIISTGRTMIETLIHLKKLKMKAAVCVVIHPVFSGNAYEDLKKAGAALIVSCNTIEHPSNQINICELINIHAIK